MPTSQGRYRGEWNHHGDAKPGSGGVGRDVAAHGSPVFGERHVQVVKAAASMVSFARRVFSISGVIGLLFVFPMYFLEGRISGQQPPPITHPEYYYGFVGVTLVFQILFLVIARDPIKYRPIMLIGVLEKVSFGLAIPMLFAAGRVPGFLLLTAFVDLGWAVLFAIAYGKTPTAP